MEIGIFLMFALKWDWIGYNKIVLLSFLLVFCWIQYWEAILDRNKQTRAFVITTLKKYIFARISIWIVLIYILIFYYRSTSIYLLLIIYYVSEIFNSFFRKYYNYSFHGWKSKLSNNENPQIHKIINSRPT